MTACVNKKKSGVVSKVVTASLVGALTLGGVSLAAVPTVALAEDGATEQATAKDAFDGATVVLNGKLSNKAYHFAYTGNVIKPVVASVTPKGGSSIDVNDSKNIDKYKVYFVAADADGKATDQLVAQPVDAGTYYVVVEAIDGDYVGGKATQKFVIDGNQSLTDAVAYEGDDQNDSNFTFNGEPADVNFQTASHEKLRNGVDYTVKYYKAGEDWNNASLGSETAPTDAGNYYARLTGKGAYATTAENVTFSIGVYAANAADFYIPVSVGETSALPTAPATVNGSEALAKHFKLTYTRTEVGGIDKYNPLIEKADKDDKNVSVASGLRTNDIFKVRYGVSFTYKGEAVPDSLTVNKAKKDKWDLKDFEATYTDGDGEEQDVSNDVRIAKVTKADGTDVTTGWDGTVDGSYVVTLEVAPNTALDYAGSVQVKVTVTSGAIDGADGIYVSYKGTVVSDVETQYTGADITGDIDVTVYNGKRVVNPADYDVEYKNSDGEVVNRIVDAGEYTATVKSTKYQLSNNTFKVTVKKLPVVQVRIVKDGTQFNYHADKLQAIDGKYQLAYSGKAIQPWLEFTTGERDDKGELIWKELKDTTDAEAVTVADNLLVTYKQGDAEVKQVKEVGDYTLTVAANAAVTAKNLDVTAPVYSFSVANAAQRFSDVEKGTWFYESVNQAAANGYINGYANTSLFGPNAAITRGQVATVLFNMAGGNNGTGFQPTYDSNHGVVTGFSDVDGTLYYGEAIAWAKQAGVVNGADGKFRPDDQVTREEFVSMLANYATLRGDDMTSSDSDLAKFADASQVSGYAKANVAWAAKNGYVNGQDGSFYPTRTITRAEVAAVAVNYQPAAIK